MADALRRVEIGFAGGLVLPVRVPESGHKALVDALEKGEADRWHTIEADEAEVLIDLAQVAYVRLGVEEARVGF